MGRRPARTVAIAALAGVMVGASLFAHQAPTPTLQELVAAARRPKLWDEVPIDKVPSAWRDSVESQRLFRRALLIDPLVDFRVIGAPPPDQDFIAIPDYGDYDPSLLVDLGDLLRDADRLAEAADAFRRAQLVEHQLDRAPEAKTALTRFLAALPQ